MRRLVYVLEPEVSTVVRSCSRCGESFTYGTKGSLWSLLPFVCIHPVADFSKRPVMAELDRMEWVDIKGPAQNAAGHPDRGVGWRPGRARRLWWAVSLQLKTVLRDQLRGYRRRWYLPLTGQAFHDRVTEREERRRARLKFIDAGSARG